MQLKNLIKIVSVTICSGLLVACGNLQDSNLANNATNTAKTTKRYQTTTTNKNGYTVLLKNGQYVVSPIAGMSAASNSNALDSREIERGLLEISKNTFSPNSYVYQEGQQLEPELITQWLSRKSKHNKAGLNLKNNGKTGENTRNPIMLEQIVEQDFLTGSGNNYQIKGISLALALNSKDYYQKKTDGPEYSTSISRSRQTEFGRLTANKIIKRLRKNNKFKSLQITIGLFSKADRNALVPGSYFMYGTAAPNSSKIDDWKSVETKTQALPTVGDEKAVNSDDASAFNSFKSAIQDYFPNISGVTATLRYDNGKLSQENILITTQFYGYSQVESFTRLVMSQAKKYLSGDSNLEIKIASVNDVQALVSKNSGDSDYYVHVFGGE